jgi:DNA polymerase-1
VEKLLIVKTKQQLEELAAYIKANDFMAVDTETTGVNQDAKIIGYSVCADIDTAYYVILRHWDKDKQELIDTDLIEPSQAVVELLATKQLVMHNAIFDCIVFKRAFGIDLMPQVHTDTMVLGHLLDENRRNGLKELATTIFGASSKDEQTAMKESITANGGKMTKETYELYKADADLIANYGAKDTILTLKLFYLFVEQLYEEGLDKFFYEEESMPLLRGTSYDLNTAGLKIDKDRLQKLRGELEAEILTLTADIHRNVLPLVAKEYPGTSKAKTFNIGATQQLSWLLFEKLGNEFGTLTKAGKEMCKALGMKLPYSHKAKREFIQTVKDYKGRVWEAAKFNPKTKKMMREKKVGDPWKYLAAGKVNLGPFASKYKWVDNLLTFKKTSKLLSTYVLGIQDKLEYGVIYSSFLQHGTTSGRYSSKAPNFMNLPRDDKRIKECVIARPGMSFVGADYSQLEPRVFASVSGDPTLLKCFESGDDFYSVVGSEIFNIYDCSLKKDEEGSFAKKHPDKRNIAKAGALSFTYGTTAPKASLIMGNTIQEAQDLIDSYFERFPKVKEFMNQSHEQVKRDGFVSSLYGRKRRIPRAKGLDDIYKGTDHADLPYEIRTLLNLAVNHKVQSTGASIINRASILFKQMCLENVVDNSAWSDVRVALQVHDELVIECPEALAEDVKIVLQYAMENAVTLPGVKLKADPVIGKTLGALK